MMTRLIRISLLLSNFVISQERVFIPFAAHFFRHITLCRYCGHIRSVEPKYKAFTVRSRLVTVETTQDRDLFALTLPLPFVLPLYTFTVVSNIDTKQHNITAAPSRGRHLRRTLSCSDWRNVLRRSGPLFELLLLESLNRQLDIHQATVQKPI